VAGAIHRVARRSCGARSKWSDNEFIIYKINIFSRKLKNKIKGPDNPTSQLLPIISFNGFSGDREGRKDKGGGERSRR